MIKKETKATSDPPKNDDFKNSLAAMIGRGKPQPRKKKPEPVV